MKISSVLPVSTPSSISTSAPAQYPGARPNKRCTAPVTKNPITGNSKTIS